MEFISPISQIFIGKSDECTTYKYDDKVNIIYRIISLPSRNLDSETCLIVFLDICVRINPVTINDGSKYTCDYHIPLTDIPNC